MRRPPWPVRALATLLCSSLIASSVSAQPFRSRFQAHSDGRSGGAAHAIQERDLDLLLDSVSGGKGPEWLEGELRRLELPEESISLASGLSAELREKARVDPGFAKALSSFSSEPMRETRRSVLASAAVIAGRLGQGPAPQELDAAAVAPEPRALAPAPRRLPGLLKTAAAALVALPLVLAKPAPAAAVSIEYNYTEFLGRLERGEVEQVIIPYRSSKLEVQFSGGVSGVVFVPNDPKLIERLNNKKVKIQVRDKPETNASTEIVNALVSMAPMFLLIGVWIFFMRSSMGGGGAGGFGKSKAKKFDPEKGPRVTFEDVAGVDEAKADLQEIVEFLRDPSKFNALGARIPRGALLVGPPGTGKTLFARAIAGEANVPFFKISGSDFVEMFVGVGASRVRDMFDEAKKNAPCIIFIDEIDAVGRKRGSGIGGGNDEREQTLNQLLVEMDGFEGNHGVIVIAATNRPDVLDPALLRPGRFDRQIVIPNPDVGGREKILQVHLRKLPLLDDDVDPKVIARGTPGFSGADLANLVNEAALLAARRGKKSVGRAEFEDSKNKVMMGAERRIAGMTEEEKLGTAYHEAGHALINLLVTGYDPLHLVSIIPRGRSLGVTMSLPERDRLNYSREWCVAFLAMVFGGRVAEQILHGEDHLTTGAGNDIQQATNLARKMVTEWGMSEKLGPVRYAGPEAEVFLGNSVTQGQKQSQHTLGLIDAEIRRLVEDGLKRANELLRANVDKLHALAAALMEFEDISGREARDVVAGKPIRVAPPTEVPKPESPKAE